MNAATHFASKIALSALLLAMAGAQAQTPAPPQTPAQPQAQPQPQVSGDDSTTAAVATKQASEMARGDPARWYVEDTTAAAHLRTLHKEIGAAQQEAQIICRKGPVAARAACLKDAHATYLNDMAQADKAAAPPAAR